MILSGEKIKKEVKKGKIVIFPFNKNNINPNSYNYTLDDYIKVYKEDILDPKKKMITKTIKIPKDGLVLEPNKLYLGCTKEVIGSNYYVPTITGRSSTGRLGLFVQITSELVDIGFKGKLTLQFCATQPVKIYSGMKIGQIMFWKVLGKVELYNGKYQNSAAPRASEIYKDFN